jgi:hypothetical protein
VKRTFLNRHGQLRPSPYGNRYVFNNKPNSVAHWAARAGPAADEMVVLIDPDFLFMSQLVLHADQSGGSGGKAARHRLGPGAPAAQNYGLGDQFLSFNLTRICGAGSPCTRISSKEVYQSYSAGPPYVIHAADLLAFATEWARLVPLTYDEYPMLYAEMFGAVFTPFLKTASTYGCRNNIDSRVPHCLYCLPYFSALSLLLPRSLLHGGWTARLEAYAAAWPHDRVHGGLAPV